MPLSELGRGRKANHRAPRAAFGRKLRKNRRWALMNTDEGLGVNGASGGGHSPVSASCGRFAGVSPGLRLAGAGGGYAPPPALLCVPAVIRRICRIGLIGPIGRGRRGRLRHFPL